MRILFAVNNDDIPEAIVKKYQKEYKEILSYKNVYYFNAIYRELQKDKDYSRVVISEDLEPFANNNYDLIDKFLLEKYTKISEEAKNTNGEPIDIILICADRRKKTDDILVRIYKNNIYNAIVGQDRSIDEICKLIYSPRDKEEAKRYYNIQESELTQTESEDSVSEAEVENIRAHYARLGKNEDKYVDSFNNIVSQYSDAQLKIIIKYLPMYVRAVLEERSPKYQQLVTTYTMNGIDARRKTEKYKEQIKNKKQNEQLEDDGVVKQLIKSKSIKSVVVPKGIKTEAVQKVVIPSINKPNINQDVIIDTGNTNKNIADNSTKSIDKARMIPDVQIPEENKEVQVKKSIPTIQFEEFEPEISENETQTESINEEETKKRGRGRPRKNPLPDEQEQRPKRGRGRPRKNSLPEEIEEHKDNDEDETVDLFNMDEPNEFQDNEIDLFNFGESEKDKEVEPEVDLFNMSDDEEDLFNIEEEKQAQEPETDLFDFEEDNESEVREFDNEAFNNREDEDIEENLEPNLYDVEEEIQDETEEDNDEQEVNLFEYNQEQNSEADIYNIKKDTKQEDNFLNREEKYIARTTKTSSNFSTLLTGDKKVVAFVGTTKNGTSFVVNNTAEMLASNGIQTAILDMTKTKNAYYIYTDDKETLRMVAKDCMEKLQAGIAEGIAVKKNLTVYTEMPGDEKEYEIETVLETLLKNYSVVLIDTDFDTDLEVFEKVQELYLVQTMDVLTIQPLTAFLRNLKSKNILKPEKLKIVINKSAKVRGLNIKTLIGGMSCYNAPNMTYMTELFNRDNIRYCEIPFEMQNYTKYLETLVDCSISLNGYTKQFILALKELADMVYPLVNKKTYIGDSVRRDPFSSEVNNTLNKMKKKY